MEAVADTVPDTVADTLAGGSGKKKLVNLPIPKETQAEYAQSRDVSVMLWLGVCILGLRWMLGVRQRICVLWQRIWVLWQPILVLWRRIWALCQSLLMFQ